MDQLTALPTHQQAAAVTFIAYVAYRALRWTYRRLLTLACMSPLPYGAGRGTADRLLFVGGRRLFLRGRLFTRHCREAQARRRPLVETL